MIRILSSVVSAVALVVGLAGPALAAEANEPSIVERGPIGQVGRWYTDGSGRALLTQGVNIVYKLDPYTPEAGGIDANDAQWLAENGFDSVRLGLIWKAVEPQPGQYNDAYLASIKRTMRELTSRGIMVLLDAHQDMYHEKFQGEFAPDWAVIDDGLPSALQVGFPTNQAVNVGLIRAYDNFLNNRDGVQDRFAAMWGHVAAFFADEPGLMGIDVMNEPWPGSRYPFCYVLMGNCLDAHAKLDALHQRVADAVTAVDPDVIVHYEPYSVWNAGIDVKPRAPKAQNKALSWHVYCISNAVAGTYTGCELPDGRAFRFAEQNAQANDAATLLSEFGATDDAATLNGVIAKARAGLVGWQYWSYSGFNDPTTQNQREQGIVANPTQPGPVTDVNREKLAILAAPHLRAAAGTPRETTWDAAARTYVAKIDPRKVDGSGDFPAGSVSEFAVPTVNYPQGYEVEVTGGRVISEPGAVRLRVAADGPVTVLIRPAR